MFKGFRYKGAMAREMTRESGGGGGGGGGIEASTASLLEELDSTACSLLKEIRGASGCCETGAVRGLSVLEEGKGEN